MVWSILLHLRDQHDPKAVPPGALKVVLPVKKVQKEVHRHNG
jgi:hypothetical protein